METKNLFLAILFFILISCEKDSPVIPDTTTLTFTKIFGGSSYDEGYSVQQTTDGGFVIVGSTSSFGAGFEDVYLIKTDASGNKVWEKTFGETNSDNGHSVEQTTDGGFVIAGHTESLDNEFQVYLIKTDASGNKVWEKTFGGTNLEHGYSVQQTTDGGFVIAGYTSSFGAGRHDIYLIKTDASGNKVWEKTFGGTNLEHGYSIQQTTDGGFVIAGCTSSFGATNLDFYLIKTDASGNKIWEKTFGGTNSEHGYSVQQTTDGGFVIAGYTSSFGAGNGDVYLIKTDASGNKVWEKTFGGTNSEHGYSIQQTTDGGFVIAGYAESLDNGFQVYLIKTDASGNKVWEKTFGGTNSEYGYSVQQTTDGGFVIAGYTSSFGAGHSDVYLIKTDASGEVK